MPTPDQRLNPSDDVPQPRIRRFSPILASIISATIMVGVGGCAQQPMTETSNKQLIKPEIQSEDKEESPLPERPFDEETLYSLLVAELAGSRNRLDIMLNNYVKQAKDTRDLGVTQRAAKVASFLKEKEDSLSMTSQWVELEPDNPNARYLAMAAMSDTGNYPQAFAQGQRLIEIGHLPHGLDALAVKVATDKNIDEALAQAIYSQYQTLAQTHDKDAELLLGTSFLAQLVEQPDQSLQLARRAQTLKPELEQAYLQELRILDQQDQTLARNRLAELVEQFPENQRLRLQLARLLTRDNLPAAAIQFEKLLEQSPGDSHIILALGLTHYEQGELDKAREQLNALIELPQQQSTAHYYLGKIAVQQGRTDDAIEHYLSVPYSNEFLPALANATKLLHDNKQHSRALETLVGHQLSAPENYQEGVALLLSDHYRSIEDNIAAVDILDGALLKHPRSETLLYSRGMLLASEGEISRAESDLRALIAINPNHADALNSLGYILADNNLKLIEAKGYIEQSLTINPDSAAAIDSLGWVNYRMGNYGEAIKHLRDALKRYPNDEIAAHLGEVLWVSGQREEAVAIWKEGLQLDPDSQHIMERLKRFELID